MGLFKKLSSALGSLQDNKSEEPSALDAIRKLKEELGMESTPKHKDENEDEELDNLEDSEDLDEIEEDFDEEIEEDFDEEIEDDDMDDEDEDEDEDEELVENRAKPIFIIRLKRFEAPLTPGSVLLHEDELSKYGSDCILMRDDENDTYRAVCLFGKPIDQLMNQAIETLNEWIEDEEEKIVPVVDILTKVECYNCEIDNDTLRKAAYFIVNAYEEQTDEIMKSFPLNDSLVRIIRESDGDETVKDVLVYPHWATLDDDDEGWVGKMISEHGINL